MNGLELKRADAEAQYQLALARYRGEGVEKDRKAAVRLWRKAADLGHSKAKFILEEILRIKPIR